MIQPLSEDKPPAPLSIDPALLRSPRLRLRQWTPADRAPFAALNADPAVMEHFPPRWTVPRATPWPTASRR